MPCVRYGHGRSGKTSWRSVANALGMSVLLSSCAPARRKMRKIRDLQDRYVPQMVLCLLAIELKYAQVGGP